MRRRSSGEEKGEGGGEKEEVGEGEESYRIILDYDPICFKNHICGNSTNQGLGKYHPVHDTCCFWRELVMMPEKDTNRI